LLNEQWSEVETDTVPTNYACFIDAIRSSSAVQPDFEKGAQLQYWLDQAIVEN